MELIFSVNEQAIERLDSKIPTGNSKNYLNAKFVFLSDEWQGIKTAIFSNEKVVVHQILEDDKCLVPWEVLDKWKWSEFC